MQTVFITGGNRGLGFELCKKFALEYGYKVYMGVRKEKNAQLAIEKLGSPKNIIPIKIDVEFEESVSNAYKQYLDKKDSDEKLNLFINNAGARLDWVPDGESYSALNIPIDLLDRIYRTNVFSSILTTRYFLPSMAEEARIVNVASGSGEFWDGNAEKDFQIGYAPSKSALIMTTKKLSAAVKNKKIYVNAVCPDWCATAMGGVGATHSAEDGAMSIVKACFLNVENPPTGKYFRQGKRIPVDVIPAQLQAV